MPANLVLSVGMPRAGSGWYYNLTHDLLVAAGFHDARQIRKRFGLQRILTEVNCNIGALTPQRLIPVMVPALLGNKFTIKAHAGPRTMALFFIRVGLIQPTYIYRDPRDALLSAYEYSKRTRQNNAFSRLRTIEHAIMFMQEYIQISVKWLACPQALHVRYEDLLQSYEVETARLVNFLGLKGDAQAIQTVVEKYRPESARPEQKGIHLSKGKIGRYRQVFTADQYDLSLRTFGSYLERMGYPL